MASLDVKKGSELVSLLLIYSQLVFGQFGEHRVFSLVGNFNLAWLSARKTSLHFKLLNRVQSTFSYLVAIRLRASSVSN